MSHTGQQIIEIHTLPNISRSKGNQAVKFGQLSKYNVINLSSQNHAENKAGTLVLNLFLFLKKLYMR